MSRKLIMALTSSVLEINARALRTCEPTCTASPASLFFMIKARIPYEIAGRVAARSPPSREVGSRAVGHAIQRSPLNGSGATVHVVVSEPFQIGRQDLEPLDT
jgi:hypothetical protein